MSENVADRIVEVLIAHGVETVFGIPGVHNLALFDALDRSVVETIVVRHEASAAYAADAYGRLTGRPGVCITTSGPGAANTVAAMGEAQASRSPMLHLTTTVARQHLGVEFSRGVLHEHPEQQQLFRPVTKLARQVTEAERVAVDVDEALSCAATAPVAPVYIEVPHDVLGVPAAEHRVGKLKGRTPGPSRTSLRDLSARLAEATRPLIWVGSGAAAHAERILVLADRIGAPVVLTHSAKRAWSGPRHPLVVQHPPHEPAVGEICAAADAVLVLGSDLDGMMTQEFRLPLANVLRVDVDARRMQTPYQSETALLGDAGDVVRGLLALVEPRMDAWGTAAVVDADTSARRTLATEPEALAGMTYVDALDDAIADKNVTLACDMAISAYWTAGYLPVRPTRRLIYPVGWGTLGFALPAAIGAARTGLGRVVVVCGDGGVLFSIGELATIAQERLPISIIIHTDGGYGMLRYDEERLFGRAFAVDLQVPDFVAVGRGFGIDAERVHLTDGTLFAAFAASLAVDGPSLLEVVGKMAPPRVTSPRWPLQPSAVRVHG